MGGPWQPNEWLQGTGTIWIFFQTLGSVAKCSETCLPPASNGPLEKGTVCWLTTEMKVSVIFLQANRSLLFPANSRVCFCLVTETTIVFNTREQQAPIVQWQWRGAETPAGKLGIVRQCLGSVNASWPLADFFFFLVRCFQWLLVPEWGIRGHISHKFPGDLNNILCIHLSALFIVFTASVSDARS